MATVGNFSAVRDGGFAGAGTSRLESPNQRPSVSPGAGNISAGSIPGGFGGGGGVRDGGMRFNNTGQMAGMGVNATNNVANRITNYNPTVSPRHWGREELNYLTNIGAMNSIMSDPFARQAYQTYQNPDGSGLLLGGTPSNPEALGTFSPPQRSLLDSFLGRNTIGSLNVATGMSPQMYGGVVAHELGHAGSYISSNHQPFAADNQEELRQRSIDLKVNPVNSEISNAARSYLNNLQLRGQGPGQTQGRATASQGSTGRNSMPGRTFGGLLGPFK